MTRFDKFFPLFLLAELMLAHAFGQTGGAVKGTLTDESGAVIPAVTVTITGGGGTKTTQTQADGTYSFTGLAPGQYTTNVTYPGFAPFSKTVAVQAGATIQLPVQLTLSAENQKVTVSADSTTTVSVEPEN